jgi:hypothetical protein
MHLARWLPKSNISAKVARKNWMMVPNHCVLYKILLTKIPLVHMHSWPWLNTVWHEQEQAFSWNSHVERLFRLRCRKIVAMKMARCPPVFGSICVLTLVAVLD